MEAVIENGKVVNIIVGHLSNSLPIEDIPPVVMPTQKIGNVSYKVLEDKVLKVYELIDLPLEELKANKMEDIKTMFNTTLPVLIDGITYNGGDSSASAISGAVTLAQALGENNVRLWDYNNVVREYTFDEAISISAQIGKAYRDTMLKRQELLTKVANATSKEELDIFFIEADKLL